MPPVLDIGSYHLAPHAIACALAGAVALAFGVVVSVRQRRYRVGRLFGVITLPIAWWQFSYALMGMADSSEVALFWARVGYLGIPLIAPAAYHFSAVLLRLYERRKFVIWTGWALALVFAAIGFFTNLIIIAVEKQPWGYYSLFGPGGTSFLAFTVGYLLLTLIEYWVIYAREPSLTARARVRSFANAFAAGSLAALDGFVFVGDPRFVVYPIGYVPVLMFVLLVARTIRRYPLVDFTPSFAATEIVDTMADALIVCDADGHIRVVNHAVASTFGYEPRELLGRSIEVLVNPDATLANSDKLHQALRRGTLRDQERVFLTKDGRAVEVSLSISQLRDRGLVAGSVVIARDIRERKRAEASIKENVVLLESALEALSSSESRYRMLFERNSAGVFRNTLDGKIVDCNDACARIFGFASREEAMQSNAFDFYADPHEREAILALLKNVSTLTNMELRLKRQDGAPVWVLVNISLLPAKGEEPAVLEGTLIDITDRKLAEEKIEFHAYHDILTKLPNRKLFTDRLTLALFHAKRNNKPLAVMFIDLDHFKVINDTLGHTAGDELLLTMADRISKSVREGDTVSRMGGDEFTLLLPDLHEPEDAAKVAENILSRIEQPMSIGNRELFVTASIGIALYPEDGHDPETLLKNADSALYLAKESGRNNYQLCTSQMKVRAQQRLALEHSLRHALDRDQFRLYFQPLVNLEKRRVTGLEALIRWNHPERGVVLPDEFIPLAENSRLIVPLGDWVLREACRHAREWISDGLPGVRVSVNLSARQFQQRDLMGTIRGALEETGLQPEHLELEITESTAMQNAEFSIDVLRALRDMGITISIDDFGTGYSSLNYLKQFPINTVKIDKGFIRDVTRNAGDAAIVSAVIGIARSLNLRVIAEGVETVEQMEFLRARRCQEMQGFLFGPPMPVDVVRENMRTSLYVAPAHV